MRSFDELKKNLKKDPSNLKSIRLAVLGDSATQLLVQALKGYGYETGYNVAIFEADYDQIDRQIFDSSSELYQFNPEFIIIFHSSSKSFLLLKLILQSFSVLILLMMSSCNLPIS
jgi:predicted enzyme involved in methoxymalonyl-ACP biosynthesis